MIWSFVVPLSCLFLIRCSALAQDPQCDRRPSNVGRSVTLSVNSKRNESGDWVDAFSARTEYGNYSDGLALDVTHKVTECDGKRVVYIQGVSKVAAVRTEGELRFHPRHGTNIEILNNGRSARKKNNDDSVNSVVFTTRPIRDDELFEIRLDEKGSKMGQSLGFGIMTSSPTDVKVHSHFVHESSAWMYYHGNIYSNNSEKVSRYGKSLSSLKVGERVGVTRKHSGEIQFYINGVSQGTAVSSIATPVYGVVELWYDAQKVTIV